MVPTMLDDNKNDTKCTPLESTKEDVERSKREDMDGPSHLPDKGWPEKNAGYP